ncbi:unnamed protein product [Rotaria socialis]|uniref:Uncharacterized protein n=2 Tax=Rotaria socialis TaxID=392032 RepID=A0A818C8T8_9BILA|nr:unnamed protein product [Rotaria socialis]
MSSFVCPRCANDHMFVRFWRFFRHITMVHQNEAGFHMTCNLSSKCGVSYRTYSAYKSHIYRNHSHELHLKKEKADNTNMLGVNNSEEINYDSNVNANLLGNDAEEDSIDLLQDDEEETNNDTTNLFNSPVNQDDDLVTITDIEKSYASFILQLREEFFLPKSTTNSISSYIATLITHLQCLIKQKTMIHDARHSSEASSSQAVNTSSNKIVELEVVNNTMNEVRHSIERITRNEYQFVNYCKEYFNYDPPEEIIVSAPNERLECGYYIPIDKTLSSIFNTQHTLVQVVDNIKQQQEATAIDNDLMFSFRDGSYGARIDDNSLLIQLYADDIGLTNPIGAKKDQHKMFMVYFSLEDVPDQYHSRLDGINLVALCNSRILKNITKARRFFEPIIENLNQLQSQGICINGNKLKFSFSTMIADNLAAHMIGGFQSSFSNGYFCRRCYTSYADRNLPILMATAVGRTCIDHDDLVQQVTADPQKSPLMGIVGKSLLYDLVGFHSTTSLPGDLMHDFLEGICPIVIMTLLKEASSLRLLTYARIQELTETFPYGHFDTSDRPPPIQVKHLQNDRISATASQKLCIFRLFPFIFYSIIDKIPSIIVYKQLREILDLVLSTPFRKEWLPILRDLCIAFQQSMLIHFPTKMVPKCHFVLEYDQIIKDYGPARKNWCMRYEAYHSYFKRIALRSNNFKNVPKMLASRYQMKQSYRLSRMALFKTFDQAIGIKNVKNNHFNNQLKQILIDHFGIIDIAKDLIQYFLNNNEAPGFIHVVNIIKKDQKWWLLVDILQTLSYNDMLCAWEIKSTDNYSILDPHHLKYYAKGLDIYELNNSSFVSFNARFTFYYKLEIDGETLALMDSIDKTTTLFPKLKQQLLFLSEREKLLKVQKTDLILSIDSSSITSTNFSSSSSSIKPAANCSTDDYMDDRVFEESSVKQKSNILFPIEYIIPALPDSLLQDIEAGALHKFGPHHTTLFLLCEEYTMNFSCDEVVEWCKSFINDDIIISRFKDDLIPSIDSSSITSTNFSSSSSSIKPAANCSTDDYMDDRLFEESSVKQKSNILFPIEYIIPALPDSLLQDIEAGALHKFGPHHTNRQVLVDIVTHDLINQYDLFYPTHKQFDLIGTAIIRQLKLPMTRDNLAIWKDAVQTKLKRKRLQHRDHVDVKHHQSKYSKNGSGRPVKRMIGEVAQRDRQKQLMLLNYDADTFNDLQLKSKSLKDNSQIEFNSLLNLWKETVYVRRKAIRDRPTSEILEGFPGYKDPVLIFEEVKISMGVDLRVVVRRQIPILLQKMITTPAFITDSPPIQLIRVLCRQFEETVHHTYCNTTPSTPYPTLVFVDHIIHVYVDFIPIVSTTSPDDALALLLAMYAIFELNFHKNSRSIRLLYAIVFADKRFLSNTIRDVIQEKQIDIYSELNRQQLTEINSITNNLVTESSTTEQPHCYNDNKSSVNMVINATEILNNNENATSASFDSPAPIVKGRKRPQKLPKTLTTEKPMPIDHDSDHENQNDCSSSMSKKLQRVDKHSSKKKRRY